MTQEQLIAKQQIEIEDLKVILAHQRRSLKGIHRRCVCVGGPLNDNKRRYTREQLSDWWVIADMATTGLDDPD